MVRGMNSPKPQASSSTKRSSLTLKTACTKITGTTQARVTSKCTAALVSLSSVILPMASNASTCRPSTVLCSSRDSVLTLNSTRYKQPTAVIATKKIKENLRWGTRVIESTSKLNSLCAMEPYGSSGNIWHNTRHFSSWHQMITWRIPFDLRNYFVICKVLDKTLDLTSLICLTNWNFCRIK